MRFPEFKGEWTRKEFGKAVKINPKREELESEFNYINLESVIDGELNKYQKMELRNSPSRAQRAVHNNDLLFQCVRPYQHNNIVFNGQISKIQWVASTGYAIIESNSPYFYKSLLSSPSVDLEILNSCTGTSYPAISSENLKKIYISIPELDECNKISNFLQIIDSRIAVQRKTIEDYKSVLNFFENNEVGKTGLTTKISELLDEKNDKSTIENQYDVLSSTKKGIYKQSEYFNKDHFGASTVGYKIIELNDVVLSPQNLWLGNISFNDKYEKGLVSPSYKVFRIKNGFDNVFIAHLLKSHKALYEYKCCSEQGASVVRRNLDFDAFQEISFKVPAIDVQRRISNKIKTFEAKIRLEESRLNSLNQLKKFLLANLFI